MRPLASSAMVAGSARPASNAAKMARPDTLWFPKIHGH
jgi:hypothetical protein